MTEVQGNKADHHPVDKTSDPPADFGLLPLNKMPDNKLYDFSSTSAACPEEFRFEAHNYNPGIGISKANDSFVFGSYAKINERDNNVRDGRNELSPKITKNHLKEKPTKDRDRENGLAGGKFSVLQKWLRGDDKRERRSSAGRCDIFMR